MNTLIALVDCDNFYASCERIFNPRLRGNPIIVLSNNDGCVISRSQEVKSMGIKMGTPFYKIKELAEKNGIAVFSSNYELYGDISARVMSILSRFTPNLECYSIDEAFLELPENNIEAICSEIVEVCRKWLSIPVKIGVSQTKTLAKAATELVKKNNIKSKYRILTDRNDIDSTLNQLPVEDVWGIGRRIAKKLNQNGTYKASEFINLREDYIRRNFSIILQRTALELKGTRCFDIETNPQQKKSICHSRSFGVCATKFEDILESITTYTSEAAKDLRKDKSKARSISVFILTNRFNDSSPQYANSCCVSLPLPANDTFSLVKYAEMGLRKIFRDGYMYKKSGIILSDLIPEELDQPNLFETANPKHQVLSKVIDEINSKYGKNTIVIASSGLAEKNWKMSRKLMSCKFTSKWDELPKVK